MNQLEERYRRVLRVLPSSYRQAWEEDMLSAFLESNLTGDTELDEYTADYGRPGWSEVASVLALAVRLRLGGAAASPKQRLWGQAVRLTVLTGSLAAAVLATAELLTLAWATGRIAWLPRPPADWVTVEQPSPWSTVWLLLGSTWAVPYVALVLGHRRPAQAVALLAAGAAVVPALMEQASGEPWRVYPWLQLSLGLVGVAAMVVFHDGVPPVTVRPWLLALPVGVAVAVPLLLLVQRLSRLGPAYSLDPAGLCCVLVTVAAAAYLAHQAWRPGQQPPTWMLVLLLHGAGALTQRLLTMPDLLGQPQSQLQVAAGLAQVVGVVAVGVPLARRSAEHLRRLPGGTGQPSAL